MAHRRLPSPRKLGAESPRMRRHIVTRGDALRVAARNHEPGAWLGLRECGALRARCRAQLATHAPPRRPRRHSAPPGAATRPSPPPIRPRARESGGGDDGAEGGDPPQEATTSPVTRSRTALDSRRVPPRAARGDPEPQYRRPRAPPARYRDEPSPLGRRRRGRGDHPASPRRWTPRGTHAREGEGARPCPGGAPAAPRAAPRAAAHGSWVAQCPAPVLSYTKFHVRLGVVCREGGRVRLSSAGSFLGGGCVRLSHRGHSVANPSFIYYICHRPHGHRPWASRDLIESRILELNPPYTKELRFR